MYILIILIGLYIYFVYRKIKKNRLRIELEKKNQEIIIRQKQEIQKLKDKDVKETLTTVIKYNENHIINEKFQNRNELVGLSINRLNIDLNQNTFTFFICIYNLVENPISIEIKDSYFISKTKEQIKSTYNENLISNIGNNNTIVPGFNVIREIKFISHKKNFDFEDVLIVNFNINGYEFFLSESCDLIQNQEINL